MLPCQNPSFKQINDTGWDWWKKYIFTDVVANLRNDAGYPFPRDMLQDKFFNPRNYTKIKKWVDDQKSQLRKEKQSLNVTGAPAKSRVKPTELQAMRDAALGGSKQMTYGINTVESATTDSPPRTTEPQETNDRGARASTGGVAGASTGGAAAGRGASVDLSNPPDNADAGGGDGGGRGRKPKGRAREGPTAGMVNDEGEEEGGVASRAEVGGVDENSGNNEESDDEDSALSDGEAEAGFSQSSPVASPSTPASNTRARRGATPQRDRGRKKKSKTDFDSKNVGDFLLDGQQQSRDQNAEQLEQMQGLATGIENAITKMNPGSGAGSGGGGANAESVEIARRRVEVEESRVEVEMANANREHLKLMLQMQQQGVGIAPTAEEWAAALAACKVGKQ